MNTKLKPTLYKLASYAFIGLIFLFIFLSLIGNIDKVKNYQLSFNVGLLISSFILIFLAILFMALAWFEVLKHLQEQKTVGRYEIFKIFTYSMLAKYLPGQIWMPVSKYLMGIKRGIAKEDLVLSIFYEVILSITSGFLIAILFLSIYWQKTSYIVFSSAILIASLLVISFFPGILRICAKVYSKISGNQIMIEKSLSFHAILGVTFYYFATHIFVGAGFFILINSFFHLSLSNIFAVVGGFALANALGTVAFFAPAGLGVREGVLVEFLRLFFPIEIAVTISLLARAWTTLGEFFTFCVAFVISKTSAGSS